MTPSSTTTAVVNLSRFHVERAILGSNLTSSQRLVLLVLLTHSNGNDAVIPQQFSPSLTHLARETGLALSSVKRLLASIFHPGCMVIFDPVG
jgi:hypothetical protein